MAWFQACRSNKSGLASCLLMHPSPPLPLNPCCSPFLGPSVDLLYSPPSPPTLPAGLQRTPTTWRGCGSTTWAPSPVSCLCCAEARWASRLPPAPQAQSPQPQAPVEAPQVQEQVQLARTPPGPLSPAPQCWRRHRCRPVLSRRVALWCA